MGHAAGSPLATQQGVSAGQSRGESERENVAAVLHIDLSLSNINNYFFQKSVRCVVSCRESHSSLRPPAPAVSATQLLCSAAGGYRCTVTTEAHNRQSSTTFSPTLKEQCSRPWSPPSRTRPSDHHHHYQLPSTLNPNPKDPEP